MHEPGFRPTHVAPGDGLPAWPDPGRGRERPSAWLDPLLPVQETERAGDWSRIVCSNGWEAWVDGRLLVALPQPAPVAGRPAAWSEDPCPLLERVERAVGRYRWAVGELAAGRVDAETFRRSMRDLRVGIVIDADAVWLFDADHDRWCYSDGTHLTTLAATEEPSAASRAAAQSAAPGETASQQPTRLDGR
ncbi:hypothetical protein NGB36_05305 [Streptomyces sp. RB6PN25]|uniref:Uncharacterized protein n=1 Tax=Streptomyces humicola TaxID=2953240 RepID=A0ABT1PQS0_9ACTN|nr:hypothetical protein [Streptomyces humicola]MCQ4080023.1 hypothetical protein [Streptomyces humicola]